MRAQKKGKLQLVNPKGGRDRLQSVRLLELFITKFRSQFKGGFTEVVVNRDGRLREWS